MIYSICKYLWRNIVFFLSLLFILAILIFSSGWIVEIGEYLYPKEPNSNAEVVKLALSIIGGVGVLLGLYIAHKRAVITEKTVANQSKQLEHAQKSQIDERFKNAVEHLGSEKDVVIMGGVAVLHQIAIDNSKNYAEVVFNILTSYIRTSTNVFKVETKEIKHTVIQMIVDYLFKNVHSKNYPYNNLRANLQSTNLSSINLNNSVIIDANLFNSFLPSLKNVHLKGSNVSSCDFLHATIENCFFDETDFSSSKFYVSRIISTKFNFKELIDLLFIESEINNVAIEKSEVFKLEAYNCKIDNLKLEDSELLGANLTGCEISDLDLSKIDSHNNLKLIGSNLYNCKIALQHQKIDFRGIGKIKDLYAFKKVRIQKSLAEKLIDKVGLEVDFSGIQFASKKSFDKCITKSLTKEEADKVIQEFDKISIVGKHKRYHTDAMKIYNVIRVK